MGNNLVTRFPNGVTNSEISAVFADLKQSDPTLYHLFYDDFDNYVAADWTVTETQAGATQALTAGDGGLLLLTNSAADDDLVLLQKAPAAFTFTAGKKAFFAARLKVSDATQSDFVVGLMIVDTTPLDATDGIYFQKDDGDANIDVYCRKNATTGSTSATAIATAVADTFVVLSWAYDGVNKVYYAVDGTVLGYLDASSTYLPDATCTVSFAIQNGEAAAKTMTVDYVFAAKER